MSNLGRFSGALFLFLATSSANAQPFEARGIGTMSCPEFLRQIEAEPTARENMYFAWAQGFMSGQNTNAGVKRDLNGDVAVQKTVLTLY